MLWLALGNLFLMLSCLALSGRIWTRGYIEGGREKGVGEEEGEETVIGM